MQSGAKLTVDELDILLNLHPNEPGNASHAFEADAIETLDELGRSIGYFRLAQLAEYLYQVQDGGGLRDAAELKRLRFTTLVPPGCG